MRLAVSDDGKTIARTETYPTPTEDFEKGMEDFKKIADQLTSGEKIEAIAGGIALVFNEDRSIPISTSNLHGWVNKPLKQFLKDSFQSPVYLENDTAVVGLGEATFGAGVGSEIVTYLTVSTGLGGARIVDGKIDKTSVGFEPGHQIIVIDGKACHCGGKGHLEAYVAGSYNPQDWNEVEKYLAIGLNNVIVHWSPQVVILGGSVMKSISVENIKNYLAQDLTIFPQAPEIILSKLGDEGGLRGALALLQNQFK